MVDAFLIGTAGRGSRSTGATAAGIYSQPPTAGNLLIAVVKGSSTTSQSTAFSQAAGTTGWTQVLVVGNSATFFARVEVWTKTAAGNDAVPSFNVMTGATRAAEVTCYEVFNANASPIDVSGTKASGASSVAISSASIAVATSGSVAASGEIGISAFAGMIPAAAATNTWTRASGWNINVWNDASTSSNSHFADEYAYAPASGAVLNWAPTITTYTGYAASLTFVIKPGSATYPVGQVSPAHRLCTGNANAVVAFGITPHGIQQIGSLLVFGVKLTTSTITLSSITDSSGITTGWTRVAGPFVDNNATIRSHEIWIARSTGTGTTNLQLTWSAAVTGLATDCDFQEFTTGYTWSNWSRRGTQQAGQNNASSSTHSWASLTASAGDTFYGLCRAVAGGPEFRTTGLGMACTWTSAGNCTMYEIGALAGASARSCLDGSTVVSYTLGVLLDYVNVWPLAGAADTDTMDANGTMGLNAVLAGSAPAASSATGAITQTTIIAGSSAPVSSANGTITQTATISGSASSVSSATGTIGALALLAGSSASASIAAGAIARLHVIAGSSITAVAGNGTITRTAIISGSAVSSSSANGTMGAIALAGSAAAASSAAGTIARLHAIAGSSIASSAANGAVVQIGVVAGSSATISSANGSLGRVTPVAGASATTSQGSGAVTITSGAIVYSVAGSAASLSGAAGTIGLQAPIAGSSVSSSSATGTVVLEETTSGSSSTVSSAFGTVAARLAIAGSAASYSGATGNLGGAALLAGSSSAVSAASGAVTAVLATAGSAVSASVAAGTVAASLALDGAASTVSSAAGTISGFGALAGSAESDSLAAGWLVGVLEIDGLSITVSGGDGTVLPPYIAGLLPPEVTGIVTVEPGPAVRVSVESADALVFVSSAVAASASASKAEGTVFVSNAVHAEVTLCHGGEFCCCA